MKTLAQQLTTYAAYHRDRRNIATHFVGVPMIFVAVIVLLARPALSVGGLHVTPLLGVGLGAAAYYLALDLRFGLMMASLIAAASLVAMRVAAAPTGTWLAVGLGLFGVGWVIQLVGHYFEGKKPAFVDDLSGLLVGPLFVVAETAFALGLRSQLHAAIVREAGPTVARVERNPRRTRAVVPR